MTEDMTLKITEPSVVTETLIVPKEPQLVMESISPDMIDYLWHLMKPLVGELAERSLGEFTVDYTYAKVKWGSTNLFYGYIVEDKDKYMEANENVSPLENKYRRIFNSKTRKEFAGYVLVEFNPNEVKPPHIWQLAIIPKYQNTNILALGSKYIEDEFRKIGCKEITMTAIREGWHSKAPAMGFQETFTLYRKKLN